MIILMEITSLPSLPTTASNEQMARPPKISETFISSKINKNIVVQHLKLLGDFDGHWRRLIGQRALDHKTIAAMVNLFNGVCQGVEERNDEILHSTSIGQVYLCKRCKRHDTRGSFQFSLTFHSYTSTNIACLLFHSLNRAVFI